MSQDGLEKNALILYQNVSKARRLCRPRVCRIGLDLAQHTKPALTGARCSMLSGPPRTDVPTSGPSLPGTTADQSGQSTVHPSQLRLPPPSANTWGPQSSWQDYVGGWSPLLERPRGRSSRLPLAPPHVLGASARAVRPLPALPRRKPNSTNSSSGSMASAGAAGTCTLSPGDSVAPRSVYFCRSVARTAASP